MYIQITSGIDIDINLKMELKEGEDDVINVIIEILIFQTEDEVSYAIKWQW